ncbi:MAG: hypothetical protein EA398_08440 [Deltaproteobacteria bacterium]|nr:MAG: hypothetical protein EA398_08440 [Deltaproteobacteria bacterium]
MNHTLNRTVLPLGLLALLFASACGGLPPMPDNLAQLDSLRSSATGALLRVDPAEEENLNVRELLDLSVENLQRSDVFYERAMDEYQRKRMPEAELAARVGLMYFRAAENYARAADARARLSSASAQFQTQIQRRNDFNARLSSERELITLLAAVQALFQRNEELRRELATLEEASRSETRAVYAIQEARIEQRTAEGLKAEEYATDLLREARQLLTRAQTRFDDGNLDEAHEIAVQALDAFRRASERARPRFMSEQDRLMRDTRVRALFEQAQQIFFEGARIDARGLVITLPDLFESRSAEIRSNRTYLLDQVLVLMREYDNLSILIEGHTDDRSRVEAAMAVSQTRADNVQNYFLQRGITQSRLNTAGFGRESPAFDNRSAEGRRNNNRAEIIFLFE